ncbi:glycosyl transferase [Actinoplanes sp. NBRC 14428]|nr:glycosyl transferase [Actinoplanes sp. NBRC 14428]
MAAPPAPVAPADEVRRRRWPVHLVAAVAFTGLGLLVMGNFVGHPVDRVSDHLANDNTWFQWLLGHGAYSVRHLENPLFSVRQNYPVGVNIMANTSVLGVTIPLAPVTMLFGVRIAYLVWMVLALAGTAFSAYYVLQRWVVRSPVAAVLGGAFAGFAPGVVHHGNGQPNFVSNFALPFIVVAVMRLGVTGRWLRDGIVLGLLVTYQVFVNEEILVVTAGACGVAVLGYALLSPRAARERARHFAAALAVTAVVAGTLCAYPLWFQFNGPGTFTALPHYHAWGEDPVAYVTFSRDTLAGDASVERTIGRTEQNSWFGWPLVLVVLAAVGALIRRSMLVRVATFTAAVLAIFSMGPKLRWAGQLTDLPGVWHWIPDDLPVFGLLTPSRITFGVVGFVALMIAVAYDAAERVRGILSGVAMLAVIAALVPLIPTPLPARVDARPPQFITSGAWRDYVPPGHSLIPLPLPDDAGGRDSLSWAAWERSEFPVPEGYFLAPDANGIGQAGVEPSVLTTVVSDATRRGKIAQVTPELRAAVRVDIARFRGSVLVLRALPGYEPLRRMVDELVGPGEQFGDAWVWRVG